MNDPRKPMFDAARKVAPLDGDDVAKIHAALDAASFPRAEGAVPEENFDPAAFYAQLKQGLTKKLGDAQVKSINSILAQMAGKPVQWVAYVLATAWHEARFKPQREWGRGVGKRYGRKGKYGQVPYGRGLVQVTWDGNYERLDREAAEAGLIAKGEVLKNFDLALRPDIAVFALVQGMLDAWYASNGKPLSSYGPFGKHFDYVHARQTVNVLDKAHEIASYARKIEKWLREAGWE